MVYIFVCFGFWISFSNFKVLFVLLNETMIMKKYIISTLLLFTVFSAFGQKSAERPGLRFAMRFTPTISWMTSDEKELVDPDGAKIGYSFGVVGDWFFQENYALSSGVFMNTMGADLVYGDNMTLKTKNSGTVTPGGEISLRPKYIEVPLGFKFLTKDFWRVRLVGQAGFNQFFLINAEAQSDNKTKNDVTIDGKDVSDEFSSVNTAYHFGFAAEYGLGGSAYLTAGCMFTMGFNDITVSEYNGIDPVNKMNSVNFQLGIIF